MLFRSTGSTGSIAITAPNTAAQRQVLITSVFFIIGFSLVFVALGASATYLGQFLMQRITLLGKIAGVLIVIFGLHTIGVFKIQWLLQEKRMQANTKPASLLGATVVGIAFAFGWTPCIGPILAAILTVAAAQETVGEGIRLLAIYSMGLAIPFLLTAIAINKFFKVFAKIRRYHHAIEIASGALIVIIGVLIFTNRFTLIANYLSQYLPTY